MPSLDYELLHNPLSAWLRAGVIFAIWFTVLPLVKMVVTRRLKALEPGKSLVGLQLLQALLSKTGRLFLIAVATWLAIKALKLPADWSRYADFVLLLILWWQVARWGSAAVRFLVEQRERVDAAHGVDESRATLTIVRVVGVAVVWVIAFLMLLANLGVDITALVAGLGIGGVAVALAVQNVLSDLFASLSIALDKPFRVGDALQIDDLTGTVEHIGIKSTRLRSVTGEQIVISNAQLLSARVRNFGRAEARRWIFRIGVTYETQPTLLREIPDIVQRIAATLPHSEFERCHLRTLAASALEYEVSIVSKAGTIQQLVELQQEFNLQLVESFNAKGIEFAYPTARQFTVEVPLKP